MKKLEIVKKITDFLRDENLYWSEGLKRMTHQKLEKEQYIPLGITKRAYETAVHSVRDQLKATEKYLGKKYYFKTPV